jgi:hypothetical protein
MKSKSSRVRRREIGGQLIFYKWKEVEPGTTIIGRYVGTRVDSYDKLNWVLQDEDGQRHALNHCGSLEHKMKAAEVGQILEICYEGTEPVKTKKYGTKDVHTFKVYCLEAEEGEEGAAGSPAADAPNLDEFDDSFDSTSLDDDEEFQRQLDAELDAEIDAELDALNL